MAIKYVKLSDSSYHLRQVIRELTILRKLTEGSDNIFTTKLLDVILPPGVQQPSIDQEVEEAKEGEDVYDLKKLTHLFLVMELGEASIDQLIR